VQHEVGFPISLARTGQAAHRRKHEPGALAEDTELSERWQANLTHVAVEVQPARARIPGPDLDAPCRGIVAIVIINIASDRLRPHRVVDAVEDIELLRGAADDNRRLRSLQRNYHFALKLGRREDRHLVEARRIGTVAKEIERRLIGEIENRSTTAAEIGHEIAHLIDAMSNLHGAGIDPSDPADAAKVVRGVVEPDVGDI